MRLSYLAKVRVSVHLRRRRGLGRFSSGCLGLALLGQPTPCTYTGSTVTRRCGVAVGHEPEQWGPSETPFAWQGKETVGTVSPLFPPLARHLLAERSSVLSHECVKGIVAILPFVFALPVSIFFPAHSRKVGRDGGDTSRYAGGPTWLMCLGDASSEGRRAVPAFDRLLGHWAPTPPTNSTPFVGGSPVFPRAARSGAAPLGRGGGDFWPTAGAPMTPLVPAEAAVLYV
ncbi:hypothetical protein VUR80DRAFT_9415 [Thermomyces stellatus]